MKRIILVAAAVGLGMVGLAAPVEAHPFGICHWAGQSGQYIYFPVPEQQEAANQHHRHMRSGVHEFDYVATAEDRAHYDAHKAGEAHQGRPGARMCVSTPPTGHPTNIHDVHA